MKRNLVSEIVQETGLKEEHIRSTLSRVKRRLDLKTTEQAACYYIKKNNLGINVSSIIDDVTRAALQRRENMLSPASKARVNLAPKKKMPKLPRVKWLTADYYSLAERLQDFYGELFIFENGLRAAIDTVMEKNFPNWWESKIKTDLPTVYKYAEDRKTDQSKLPMVGQGQLMQPFDYVTITHLEQIIIKYENQFVPTIFPNLHFFTGHMVIVKRVRNAIAHMAPSTTKDVQNAKNEIDILLQHLSTL